MGSECFCALLRFRLKGRRERPGIEVESPRDAGGPRTVQGSEPPAEKEAPATAVTEGKPIEVPNTRGFPLGGFLMGGFLMEASGLARILMRPRESAPSLLRGRPRLSVLRGEVPCDVCDPRFSDEEIDRKKKAHPAPIQTRSRTRDMGNSPRRQ